MKKILLITMLAAFLFGGFTATTTAVASDAETIVTVQDITPDKDKDKDDDKKDKKSCCDKDKKASAKKGDCDKSTSAKKSDCDKKSKAPCKSKSSPDKG
jgi:Ni/Co efflux regulator RcnB